MASSSSFPRRGWTHGLFLSFRGEDTRNGFVDHLHAALVQKGIHVFKDDQMLHVGKLIASQLLQAIEESKFAVVVFSENYANSSWCLQELAKIMECHYRMGLKVLPVFYHVDPSDVRKQKGSFAIAFQEHEHRSFGGKNELNKWREALTAAANLSGYHISAVSGGESTVINKIVQVVFSDIQACGREKNLVGIECHMDALYKLLRLENTNEVRFIGIHGMGGIGKTTIAQSLFRRIAYMFGGSCFLKDVREHSSGERDLCALQKTILKDILAVNHKFKIQDPEFGADMIQESLCNKKVLLVLDDVDDFKQLDLLAATHEWFGPGSRIIITARDERLLSDASGRYKPPLLVEPQALELFSKHAFQKNGPPKGYEELSYRAVRYSSRLPLAVKVLGSYFRGMKADVWGSALDRLAETPNNEIFKTLKLSFDGLEESEKKIFLDIACFFKGKEVEYVTRVLSSFGFHPKVGISSLIEKSLITVSEKRIGMHELLQEMGWQIVQQSAPCSRLWQFDQIHDFIKKNKNLHKIEALVAPRNQHDVYAEPLSFNDDVFKAMTGLRLLDVEGKFTSREPVVLPDELRWLCWNGYPFSSLPLVDMYKLAGLEMESGQNKYLWKGKQIMRNLKFIRLHNMDFLTRFPDVSGAPNVESLVVSGCKKLEEVDESVGLLKRVVELNMSGCENLKRLPSRIEMESLEILILSYCESLERFPELSECMVKLSHIDVSYCDGIEALPSSIKYASSLSYLNLNSCRRLENISDSICELQCLKIVSLYYCPKLQKLPVDFNRMKLEELHMGVIPYLWKGEQIMRNLSFIGLHKMVSLTRFPDVLSGAPNVECLNLSGCDKLEEVDESVALLDRLFFYCDFLEILPEPSECTVKLWHFHLVYCDRIKEVPSSIEQPA